LSFTVSRVAANLPEYVDRTATFTGVIVVLSLLIGRPPISSYRAVDRSVLSFGALWWAGSLALTVFLPVRSSLYACLPSVGIALMGAAIIAAVWPFVPTRRQRLALWIGLLLPFVLWPVYHARNGRWVREAELSSETIKDLQEVAKEHGSSATVLLKDDASERPSLVSTFGSTLPAAVRVMVSPQMIASIDPPPVALPRPERFDAEFQLQGGKLIRIR
jgi:hypothetical protein